jgi:acetyl-CoA/propionyl-CoA carboxylase, biotin carboxylase, biotin carboxyl carrier protein
VESEALAQRVEELREQFSHLATMVAAGSDGASPATRERVVAVEVDGRRHDVRIHTTEPAWAELGRRHKERSKGLTGAASGAVVSPMQGVVLHVGVAEGDPVEPGDLICVIEAMKMENEITANRAGVVHGLVVRPGEQVVHGQVICVVEEG